MLKFCKHFQVKKYRLPLGMYGRCLYLNSQSKESLFLIQAPLPVTVINCL